MWSVLGILAMASLTWLLGFVQGSDAARANVEARIATWERMANVWRDKAVVLMNRLDAAGLLTEAEALARGQGRHDYHGEDGV